MRRALAVVIALVAIMAVQGAPENTEATDVRNSECYDCHKAGGEGVGPVLQHTFRMFLHEAPDLEPGAATELNFDIRNWWTAEMMGFEGYIDIGDAPALSFEATKAPVHGSKEGELPEYAPAAYYQQEERTAQTTIDVPAGGTDLTITVAPEEGSDAQLTLRIWTPAQNPSREDPVQELQAPSGGEPVAFNITADPVEAGRYTLEVAETPDTFATPTEDTFAAIGFEVDWTLSFKFVEGATMRNGGSIVVLDGQDDRAPQDTQVSWSVNVIRNITTEQRIYVYMESVAFYDHPPQFRAVDEWLYWEEVEYFLTPQDDGTIAVERVTPAGDRVTEFIVGEQVIEVAPVDEGPDLTVEEEGSLDTVSEAIGYVAAFLLVMSLLTGGAFGNWSRRFQQWMLYRRARKRVAFHNVISYGLISAATIHMVLFLVEPKYPWSIGFFLGGVSILGMYMSGVTGIFQRPMVSGMGHELWRWTHYMSFVLAFAGAAGHILLDGIHFADLQAAVGWEDPVAPVLEGWIPIDNSTAPADPPPA